MGDEAVALGIANKAVVDVEALDELVNERVGRIAANSQAAVAAPRTSITLLNKACPYQMHCLPSWIKITLK